MTEQPTPRTPQHIAIDMVTGVRDDGRQSVYDEAALLPPDVLLDVVVRLAEMVPDSKRLSDLLAWKTDRRRRARRLTYATSPIELGGCPSPAAYARHVANGEQIDDACRRAHDRYERGYTLRRAA